mgnify:CR=1 FL=1
MHQSHPPDRQVPTPALEGDWSPEPDDIPRWVQIIAGVVLLPIALLSTAGAISIFGIPKVKSDPLLQLVAAVICLLAVWSIVLAFRLILGARRRKWFFGPVVLRVSAVVAVGLVIGGAFSDVWGEHPVRTALLSISYVLLAIRFWSLAAYRSRSVA